jgi:hypothetical protein
MSFELLSVIVWLNVMATVALWQYARTAARKPEKLKKKFFSKLLRSDPIIPQHQPPKTIPSTLRDDERRFFNDFADFGAVLNWGLSDQYVGGPFRLQGLPETDCTIDTWHGPRFGRRYAIFHNQVRLGLLEVRAGLGGYSTEQPNVITFIKLSWVRLLEYQTILGFLHEVTVHVCDYHKEREYFLTQLSIDRVLTEHLWCTQRITDLGFDGQNYGELEFRLNGSALCYLKRRDALRERAAA